MKIVLLCAGGNCKKFRPVVFANDAAYRASKAVGFKNYPCPYCRRTTHNEESSEAAMQARAEARY